MSYYCEDCGFHNYAYKNNIKSITIKNEEIQGFFCKHCSMFNAFDYSRKDIERMRKEEA